MEVHRIYLCDEIELSQYNKLTLIGYNPGDQIAIDKTSYTLETHIVMEGSFGIRELKRTSIRLIYRDQNDRIIEDKKFTLEIEGEIDKDKMFVVAIPIRWLFQEYGKFEIIVYFDEESIFRKTFNVLRGEAPRVRLTEKLVSSSLIPTEGQISLKSLIGRADRELILIDPYLDPDTLLQLISYTSPRTSVKVLTSPRMKPEYKRKLSEIRRVSNKLEIKFSWAYHDRFIVVNRCEYYHFGHSFKDMGKKISRYSLLYRKKEIEDFERKFDAEWSIAGSLS